MSEQDARFGRRQAGKGEDASASESKGEAASRRRAADGSEIAGGRADAPSGWGEANKMPSVFSKKTVLQGRSGSEEDAAAHKVADEDEGESAKVWNRQKFPDQDDVGVTVIKDFDAPEVEDLETKVAEAPRNVAGRKVQTLKELTEAGQLDVASSKLAGIDLSLLTAVLCAPEALDEPDEVWDFDPMLQQVSQAMTAEQEKQEAEDAAVQGAATV